METSIAQNRYFQIALVASVVILSFFIHFYHLGEERFYDYDEATYADVIVDTEVGGNLYHLQRNDKGWYEKPPLYFWLAMGVNAVVADHEFAYRAPSALAGVLVTLLIMLITYFLTGNILISALAGLFATLSAPMVEAARQLRLDTPVLVTILLAFYFFLLGLKKPAWLLGMGVAVGLGLMLKSVIALLAGPVILIWAVVHNKWLWLKSWYTWLGALGMLIIVVPWHWYMSAVVGTAFWYDYIGYHVLARFEENIVNTTVTTAGYFSFLLVKNMPWTILWFVVTIAVLWVYRIKFKENADFWSFTAIAAFIIFAFSLAETKIIYYLIPALPFITLATTFGLVALFKSAVLPAYWLKRTAVAVVLIALGLGLAQTIHYGYRYDDEFDTNRIITLEEFEAGILLRDRPEPYPLKAFEYPYWETVHFYSQRPLARLDQNDMIGEPFFFIAPAPLMSKVKLDDEVAQYITRIYHGVTLNIYKFEPK